MTVAELGISPEDIEKFRSGIQRGSEDECRPVKGKTGYGSFRFNGKSMPAHRLAYLLEHPLP